MAESEKDTRPPLVLVANDQEWSGRSLETILGPRGYAVLRAYTGRQVLDAVRATQPDVLVLDSRMPDTDAMDLCYQLRTQRLVSVNTAIIITTSSQPTRSETVAALQAGAWDICHHPIDAELLVLRLDTYVRAKRAADQARDESLLDQLTGLYNVRGLTRRARELAAEALRGKEALACVALAPAEPDAELGEQLVETIAQRVAEHLAGVLVKTARASDVVGHLGRSEFAVIAPATGTEGAERLMERLQSTLESSPITVDGMERRVRIRGGYYAVPNYAASTVDAIEMLERASAALRARTTPAATALNALGGGPRASQIQ